MHRIFYTVLFLAVVASSCKSYLTHKYGFNQNLHFATRADYTTYLTEKKGFPLSSLLYVDGEDVSGFMNKLISDNSVTYYGAFINDSLEVTKSSNLQENTSCMGKVLKELEKDVAARTLSTNSLLRKSNFNAYSFRSFSNNQIYQISQSNKQLKIFLVYSYKLGSYYDELYKQVLEFTKQHENEVDLNIIAIDIL